jgi:hypothetical protein
MLQKQTVATELLELVKQLQQMPELRDFVLVGGTALALQLGHRVSVDIDLFTTEEFDTESLNEALRRRFGKDFLLLSSSRNTINASIAGIKVDLIRHGYPYIANTVESDNIRMAALPDIAAMNLNAITGNGSRIKDFTDVYFLLERYSLAQLLDFYRQKYTQQDITQVKKSLVYFNDVLPETWKTVQLIDRPTLTFQKVKGRLKTALIKFESQRSGK